MALIEPDLPIIHAVALALLNRQNEWLIAQRPAGKILEGFWEFPGGKMNPNETPEQTAIREAQEELGITISPEALHPHGFCSHAYPHGHVILLLYVCKVWQGAPHPCEGQTIAWKKRDKLHHFPDFLPASRSFLDSLHS